MKRSVALIVTLILLIIIGFFTLDAYLCAHLYYGIPSFTSCAGGQGAGLKMISQGTSWAMLFWGLVASFIPIGYMIFAKKINLRNLVFLLMGGAILYALAASMLKDALLSAGFIILIFNFLVIFAVLLVALALFTVLGHILFRMVKWHVGSTMHDIFSQFALGLIAFCVINIVLLLSQVFFGVVVRAEFIGGIFLLWKQRKFLATVYKTLENFVQTVHESLSTLPRIKYVYYALLIVTCLYVFIGLNLAYIPYPTAWDANHAYMFFPRAWAINNGIYWGADAAGVSVPYIWYGFLTFWFKLAQSFPMSSGFFGISPDGFAVLMNFWSGPLVLLASGFLLHAFIGYLASKGERSQPTTIYTLTILCVGWFLMLLWLTSGMGAFLVFVDNKTDLAVMFLSVLALYVGIQLLHKISYAHTHDRTKSIKQYAILSGILFAAAAVAKPTAMFDIIHFGVLFLLEWQIALFGLGAYVLVLGVLGKTEMLLIEQFITQPQSNILIAVGVITIVVALFVSWKKYKFHKYLHYFGIWALTIIVGIVLYKGPYVLIQQAISNGTIDIHQAVRGILLGQINDTDRLGRKMLLASTVSPDVINNADQAAISMIVPRHAEPSKEQCLAEKIDTKQLYEHLQSAPLNDAGSEDLGRYIGYGWKTFTGAAVVGMLPDGCYSVYADAQYLCKNIVLLQRGGYEDIMKLLNGAPATLEKRKREGAGASGALAQIAFVKDIISYTQSNSLLRDGLVTAIPYKYLVPLNVTFNRSLQNLSSYYTDIGIIWVLGLFLVMIGGVYGLIKRQKQLVSISLITLGAWATRWAIASAIIWYSLGLIVRTILGIIAYFYYLFRNTDDEQGKREKILIYLTAGVFLFLCTVQLLLNFVRIASQGGSAPFLWYKSNVGEVVDVNDQLQSSQVKKIGYTAKDVFNLQFPHYNKFLNATNKRAAGEGVIIAGTYSQYFVDDQNNLQYDGFLTEFWKNSSDNNVCNTYLRLKDKAVKYIAIDPNIASVVMGDANSTLLDRFLGVISPDNKLIQQGTLTMLQSLVQNNYLKLFSTNNIITKYAFIIDDQQLSSLLNVPVGEALLIERAKMSAARFFPNVQLYATTAAVLLANRVGTYEAIEDIADVYGKEIRYDILMPIAKTLATATSQATVAGVQNNIKDLTDDEKIILQQFLAINQAKQQNPTQFRQYINQLISQSVNNGSQIIVFSVE